jgi:polyhydroxyalkanoate synthesis regulator phasin
MTEEYLRPEDVRPEHAREVLDFLNAAQTAEQIAAAVEIPGEPDIGVRLGQRILDRRQQLGSFTNLRQIDAIPLIGPERFTEIVITLSGARAPRAPLTELLREIHALREQVKALQTAIGDRPQVALDALQERPFLGQAVNLVATVTEAGGERPQIDAPLTLTTTWGRLRATDGPTTREGNSVTTRTDGNGMARALLLPPTSEDLLPVQQDTLETALRTLDPEAAAPRAIESGLQELARQYRLDSNTQLRRAIDIYFRDFGEGLLETVNARDYLLTWSYLDSTVLAYVRDDAGSGSGATAVRTTAALSLRFKNWLGPWLEKMQTDAPLESELKEDLKGAKETEEAGALLGHVYSRVRDFVSAQQGLVGEYVGERIAETSLRKFLQTGIEDLPQERQLAIFPALDVASHTVASSGANVLAAVGQTHAELRQELNTKIGEVETGSIDVLTTRVEDLQSQLGEKVDSATFDNRLDQLQGDVNNKLATKVDNTTFTDRLDQMDAKIGEIETGSIDVLTTRVENLQSQLDEKVDAATFDAALDAKLDATEFRSFETEVNTKLVTKVDTTTFDAALAEKADESGFDRLHTEVNNKLAAKVDTTTFDTALAQKVDSATFTTRLGSLQGKITRLEDRVRRPSG